MRKIPYTKEETAEYQRKLRATRGSKSKNAIKEIKELRIKCVNHKRINAVSFFEEKPLCKKCWLKAKPPRNKEHRGRFSKL